MREAGAGKGTKELRHVGTKGSQWRGRVDCSSLPASVPLCLRSFAPSLRGFLLFLCLLPVVGCNTAAPGGPMVQPIAQRGDLPSYAELVQRYNANIAGLDRLWARADVTLRYKDEKGRWRSDRGDDSKLLLRLPDEVALAVGGIGPPVLWIGGDAERYWVFHLRDEKPVYFGSRAMIGSASTESLPSPIYPHQLPWMLGVVPLDPNVTSNGPLIEWHRGYYLIEPPGTNTRMLIDPRTARPIRIDLLDPQGRSTLAVRLHDPVPVQQGGTTSSATPTVPSRIEAWVLGEDTQVTLKLRTVRDGRGDRAIERAFDTAFDFERLLRAHQPGVQVDLDTVDTQRVSR